MRKFVSCILLLCFACAFHAESLLYTTSFNEWESQIVSSQASFNYSGIDFTASRVKIYPSEKPSGLTSYEGTGYIQPYSSTLSSCYIQTGRLDYVSRVTFTHAGKAGCGWKLESSSDGENFYPFNENETGCAEKNIPEQKEVYVYMNNVWLRWSPISTSGTGTEMYLLDINIYGDEEGGGVITDDVYSLVGVSDLFGADWNVNNTSTEMTQLSSDNWVYTLNSVYLKAYHNYEYKVVRNHSWDEGSYPANAENYSFHVLRTGYYSVAFALDVNTGATATPMLLEEDASVNDTANHSNYAMIINGERIVPMVYAGVGDAGYPEYLGHLQVQAGEYIEVINRANNNYIASTDLDEYGEYQAFTYDSELNRFTCSASGCYDVYLKSNGVVFFGVGTAECSSGTAYDGAVLATGLVTVYTSSAYAYGTHGWVKLDGSSNNQSAYQTVALGTTVTIEAVKKEGYQFLQWSDNNYANPRQVLVTGDTTIEAVFGDLDIYPTGILVNRRKFVRSTFNDGDQLIVRANLQQGDTVELYYTNDNIYFMAPLEPYGAYQNFVEQTEENRLICLVSGCYDIYFKLEEGITQSIYIGNGTECFDGEDWTAPASTESEYVYSLVGTANLFGEAWVTQDTTTEMKLTGENMYEYVIDSIALYPDSIYEYKVIANHAWNVKEYPNLEENYTMFVEEPGVYQVLFMLNPDAGCSATTNRLHGIIENPSSCIIASGKCGADADSAKLIWTLSCDSVLTISGTGEMANYKYPTYGPWNENKDMIAHVMIEEGVTGVGEYAFSGCSNLASVYLPESLEHLRRNAFASCSTLVSITIPQQVDTISTFAFSNCSGLINVYLNDNVSFIEQAAFFNCSNITYFYFPKNLRSIEGSVFNGCTSLNEPLYNDYIFAFLPYSFEGEYSIPEGITTIAGTAFVNRTNLTNVTIPNSVLSVETAAFNGCTGLTYVTIPNSVTNIGHNVFSNCSQLEEIIISENLASIGSNVFSSCTSLRSITCNAATPPSASSSAFNSNASSISLYVPKASIELYRSAEGWSTFTNIQAIGGSSEESSCLNPMIISNLYTPFTINSAGDVWIKTSSSLLPLGVFYPTDVSGELLKAEVNYHCDGSPYSDPTLQTAVAMMESDNGITLPFSLNFQETDRDGMHGYEAIFSSWYVSMIQKYGVSSDFDIYIKLTIPEAVAPDSEDDPAEISLLSNDMIVDHMADAKYLKINDTIHVVPFDSNTVYILPLAYWRTDSVSLSWNGSGTLQMYIGDHSGFTPEIVSPNLLYRILIGADGSYILPPDVMTSLATAANSEEVFAKFITTGSAGILTVKRHSSTDSSNLDIPSIDFAAPYVFTGAAATLSGRVSLDGENYMVWSNNTDATQNGIATWQVNVTRPCSVSVTLNLAESGSGHRYQVSVLDADDNLIGEPLAEPANSWVTTNLMLDGTIDIPAAGTYTIRLTNLTEYSENIIHSITLSAGNDLPQGNVPTDLAPTPTYDAAQVRAIYSPTYGADCEFGEWGSGTTYMQDEYGKKYSTTNMGYFGMTFDGLNCTEMEYLHFDIWAAEEASMRIVPIWGGTEQGMVIELSAGQWSSIDFPLSEFDEITDWSNVYQIKIQDAPNLTFWIGNAYFYATDSQGGNDSPSEINYYLLGTGEYLGNWILKNALPMNGDSIRLELPEGYYNFKILTQNTSWDNVVEYSNLNMSCSSEEVTVIPENNDFAVNLSQDTIVTVKVVDDMVCITFNSAIINHITSYTLVGDPVLFNGENWNFESDVTNLVPKGNEEWSYKIDSVSLTSGDYQYNVVANHSWVIAQYHYILHIEEDGAYSVLFSFNPDAGCSATTNYLHAITETQSCNPISGTCGAEGDNLTWTLTCDSVLTISGSGAMANYNGSSEVPWHDYQSVIRAAVIESGVTSLSSSSTFENCTNMVSVTIPEGITTLGIYTFADCSSLKSVDLPSTITSLGSYCFSNCWYVDSIICRATTPPEANGSALAGVNYMIPIYVPAGTIEQYMAAEGWSGFTDYRELNAACIIASGNCGAQEDNVTWSLNCDSVLTISGTGAMATYSVNSNGQAPWAEYGSQINEIVIEEGVTSIGAYSFYNAGSYTNGAYNNVRTLTIPSTVSTLTNNYFYQCPLQTVTINSDTIVGGGSYSSSSSLHKIFGAQVRKYIIGEGVTSIASSAFYNQSPDSLQTVILPEGITSIGTWAFGYLENMDSIALPSTLQSIGADAFYGSGLRSITIPAGVTDMGGQAFQNCDKLTLLTLEEGLKAIGTNAFTNCTALPEITIPQSIETVGSAAFSGCTNLTKATVLSPTWVAETKSSSSITKQALGGNIRELILGDNITTLGKYAFCSLDSLRHVSLPMNVEVIGEYAFSACKSLRSVELPGTVTTIGNYAFNGCTAMDSVRLGEGLLRIGTSAFYQCTSMQHLTLPESLRSINSTAFYQCTGLTELIIPGSVDSLGSNIFGACTNLTQVTVNSNNLCSQNYSTSTNIKSAFNQDAIKTYIIGEGVTILGKYAFYNASMTDVVLPATLTQISTGAFGSCTSLTRVTSNAFTPPSLQSNSFSKQDTLIVPCEAKASYKAADYWKNFSKIQCDGETEMTVNLTSDWTFVMLPSSFGMEQGDVVTDGNVRWATYNGSVRAMGASGWENYDAASVHQCSQALIVKATEGTATLTVHVPSQAQMKDDVYVNIFRYPATHEQNANWNFIGNPYPYSYDIMATLEAQGIEAPITIWNGTGYTTLTPGLDPYVLQPFEAFFIQLPDDAQEYILFTSQYITQ